MAAEQFADSAKSWAAAERSAASPAERDRIRQARLDVEDRRAEAEVAEKKRKAEEAARELQRIKDSAAAEVHAAEDAANKRLGQNPTAIKNAIAWWEDPTGTKVEGSLTRVDCLNGPLRLTVTSGGVATNFDPRSESAHRARGGRSALRLRNSEARAQDQSGAQCEAGREIRDGGRCASGTVPLMHASVTTPIRLRWVAIGVLLFSGTLNYLDRQLLPLRPKPSR
jgi:hypothetical protein